MVEGARAQQKAATRRRLLDAAVEVFATGSVMTTPVEQVAAAAGVSKATLFFHFNSRTELLEEVASRLYGRGPAWRPGLHGLESFLDAYFRSQASPDSRLVWEIGDLLTVEGRSAPSTAYVHLVDHIADRLVEDGHEPDRARSLAGVVAPAALLVGRRLAYSEAAPGELERFRADLTAILSAHRETP